MRRVLFPLGALFVFIGIVLFRSVGEPYPANQPTFYYQTGVLSKIDNYNTSKFGEVLYFELEGIEARFWMKARLEKTPEVKDKLLSTLRLGDTITAKYTSLKGTPYEYASAPNNVHSVDISGETLLGFSFAEGGTGNTFTNITFYVISSIMFIAVLIILGLGIYISFR